jgi:hypothetical protein
MWAVCTRQYLSRPHFGKMKMKTNADLIRYALQNQLID